VQNNGILAHTLAATCTSFDMIDVMSRVDFGGLNKTLTKYVIENFHLYTCL